MQTSEELAFELALESMREAMRRGDGVYVVTVDPSSPEPPELRMLMPLTEAGLKRWERAHATQVVQAPRAASRPREHCARAPHAHGPPNDDDRPRPCACGCGRQIPAGSRAHRKAFDESCRKRLQRRRGDVDAELLGLFTLAREAIAAGADPELTLSLVLWPPQSGDEARALLGIDRDTEEPAYRFPNSHRSTRAA